MSFQVTYEGSMLPEVHPEDDLSFDQARQMLQWGYAVMRKNGGGVWFERDCFPVKHSHDGIITGKEFADEDEQARWVRVLSMPNGWVFKLPTWSQGEAIDLCIKLEELAPEFGCHVALTGGLLYKSGPRKDADILFYRIRQSALYKEALLDTLEEELGFEIYDDHGFVVKAGYQGRSLDLLFPDVSNGTYGNMGIPDQVPF